MIKIYDINGYEQNDKTYGGTAGVKIGITINNQDYLVKYPGKLKDANMKNVEISYSNSPVCEYIGCKIYESVGIPVQNVWLGERNGKIVVICKDFLNNTDTLIPFRDIRATFEPTFTDPQGDITNGTGTILGEIMRTLDEHPLSAKHPALKERFWDMFVVDALIGNPDRNNENWGLIRDINKHYFLTPVYDCGNCLNNKLSEHQMRQYLSDSAKLAEAAIQRPCIFERKPQKRINPYKYILEVNNPNCNEAIKRIVPNINISAIEFIINEIPDDVLGETAKEFYTHLITIRNDLILQPAYEQLISLEQERDNDINNEYDDYDDIEQ